MDTKETVLFLLGVFLIVIIIGMLVKIYYVVEQHGLQISVLLKHEKEGFVPWRNYANARNYSSKYKNELLPENKQLTPNAANMVAPNNTRAQRQCHILTEKQLDGLAGHAANADNLNITTEESLKTGNLSSMDVNVQSNYIEDEGPAIDQTAIKQDESNDITQYSGNPRTNPAFLQSMTEGVKQANESGKERFRNMRRTAAHI